MITPEFIARNWKIKLISFIIALLIWYFVVGTR